jgi:hypothetical protein
MMPRRVSTLMKMSSAEIDNQIPFRSDRIQPLSLRLHRAKTLRLLDRLAIQTIRPRTSTDRRE